MNLGAVFRSKSPGDGKTVMTSRQAHWVVPREPWVTGDRDPNPRLRRTPSQHTTPGSHPVNTRKNRHKGLKS